jgi:PPOX class probable F420-dependent enzyme
VATTYDWIQHQPYLLLTTFKRDGTPVPTPVWFAAAGGELYLSSGRNAGKVKRIRATGRVEVCPCTMRGKPTGPAITGQGTVLGDDRAEFVHGLLKAKYGWRRTLVHLGSAIKAAVTRHRSEDDCIAVTLDG